MIQLAHVQVYVISQLGNIRAGAIPITADEDLDIGSEKDGNREDRDEPEGMLATVTR